MKTGKTGKSSAGAKKAGASRATFSVKCADLSRSRSIYGAGGSHGGTGPYDTREMYHDVKAKNKDLASRLNVVLTQNKELVTLLSRLREENLDLRLELAEANRQQQQQEPDLETSVVNLEFQRRLVEYLEPIKDCMKSVLDDTVSLSENLGKAMHLVSAPGRRSKSARFSLAAAAAAASTSAANVAPPVAAAVGQFDTSQTVRLGQPSLPPPQAPAATSASNATSKRPSAHVSPRVAGHVIHSKPQIEVPRLDPSQINRYQLVEAAASQPQPQQPPRRRRASASASRSRLSLITEHSAEEEEEAAAVAVVNEANAGTRIVGRTSGETVLLVPRLVLERVQVTTASTDVPAAAVAARRPQNDGALDEEDTEDHDDHQEPHDYTDPYVGEGPSWLYADLRDHEVGDREEGAAEEGTGTEAGTDEPAPSTSAASPARPRRRAAASASGSLREPSLTKKMRRGDPCSSTIYSGDAADLDGDFGRTSSSSSGRGGARGKKGRKMKK